MVPDQGLVSVDRKPAFVRVGPRLLLQLLLSLQLSHSC